MVSDFQKKINALDAPAVVEVLEYNDILEKNIALLKTIIPDYQPLESDRYMKILRVISNKEFHSQIDRNEVIKQLLITTAIGNNLDHLGARLDVFRLDGAKPTARYEFKTSKILSTPIVIPDGLELIDESGIYKAKLLGDLVVPVGSDSAIGLVELDLHIVTSKIQTIIITTPLPYVVNASAKEDFNNGDEAESDEKYRIRQIRSLGKYSTAGSKASYLYWIYSADSRIDDVSVFGVKGSLEVNIYLHSKDGVDGVMLDRVESILSDDKVRPIGDEIAVYTAIKKEITINATMELFDLSTAPQIRTKIEEYFNNYTFSIGEHLTRSDVVKRLHQSGVYKADTTFTDKLTTKTEIITLKALNLTFTEAVL